MSTLIKSKINYLKYGRSRFLNQHDFLNHSRLHIEYPLVSSIRRRRAPYHLPNISLFVPGLR